jgi:hypothetical protein
MSTTTERAAAALELLPEEMREPAIAYLFEQAEKFRALKQMIAEGMEVVASGRISEWNFEDFLHEAHALRLKSETLNEDCCIAKSEWRFAANLFLLGPARSKCG